MKNGNLISPANVFEYSDSTELIEYDSLGSAILSKVKIMRPGGYVNNYFTSVGISQDWYYNKTKNLFFNEINKAYLYIGGWRDDNHNLHLNDKRFEINF